MSNIHWHQPLFIAVAIPGKPYEFQYFPMVAGLAYIVGDINYWYSAN